MRRAGHDLPSRMGNGLPSFGKPRGGWPSWCPLVVSLVLGWLSTVVPIQAAEAAAPDPGQGVGPTFSEWREACRKLPLNRELGDRLPPLNQLPLRIFAQFLAVLDPVLDQCRTGALASARAWLGEAPRAETFLNLETGYFQHPTTPFEPFAQREVVPTGTRLFFHGDLHGDIHALLTYLDALNREGHLDGFRVVKPDVRLVFLGDYTDRGRYGVEVLYTLLRLRWANPDQVLLVRGNHEDVNLVARYGFLAEANAKFGRSFDARRVVRFYDFLPAVLYVVSGTNVIQCNHGGMEPGFQPAGLLSAPPAARYQRLGRLEQRRFLADEASWVAGLPAPTRRLLDSGLLDFTPQTPTTPNVLGFMWNDFTVLAGDAQFAIDPGRAYVYGDELTRRILDRAGGTGRRRVRALFRGHQHSGELNPLMRRLIAARGIFRHWQTNDAAARLNAAPALLREHLESGPERAIPDGSVWTFNVSPDSVYGAGCGFTFDTAGELVTAERWEDWRLKVRNFPVVESP